MIYKGGKEVASIYKGNKAIAEIYKGAVLVWQAVKSCFGKGFLINDKPWSNEEGWKNNL